MTRHDELLAEAVLREVRGLTTRQAVLRLFEPVSYTHLTLPTIA